MGEKPDSTDFNNVGRGINLLINEGLGDERIAKGMIGYQSGGVVDTPPPFLDVESWVQESFKKHLIKLVRLNLQALHHLDLPLDLALAQEKEILPLVNWFLELRLEW